MNRGLVRDLPRQVGCGRMEQGLQPPLGGGLRAGQVEVAKVDVDQPGRHRMSVQVIPDQVADGAGTDAPVAEPKGSCRFQRMHEPRRGLGNRDEFRSVAFGAGGHAWSVHRRALLPGHFGAQDLFLRHLCCAQGLGHARARPGPLPQWFRRPSSNLRPPPPTPLAPAAPSSPCWPRRSSRPRGRRPRPGRCCPRGSGAGWGGVSGWWRW